MSVQFILNNHGLCTCEYKCGVRITSLRKIIRLLLYTCYKTPRCWWRTI